MWAKKHHRMHAEWKFCLYNFGFTEMKQASDRKSIAAIKWMCWATTRTKIIFETSTQHTDTHTNPLTWKPDMCARDKTKTENQNMFSHEKWMNLSNTRRWRLYVRSKYHDAVLFGVFFKAFPFIAYAFFSLSLS